MAGADNWFGGNSPGSSLGLNLGLRPGQRSSFRQATQSGNLMDWLQGHPNVTGRMGRQMQGSPDILAQAQRFFGANETNRQRAGGAPAAAGQKGGTPPPPTGAMASGQKGGTPPPPTGAMGAGGKPTGAAPANQGGRGMAAPNLGDKPPKRPPNQGG